MFYVKSINLTNFRCYLSKKIELAPKINIIYGDNATGKTTILEAISYNSICKSFKNVNDADLINDQSSEFNIKTICIDDEKENFIDISYSNKGKRITKNGKKYSKLSEYIGYIQSISFEPSDLEVIKGAPSERRRLLNMYISQFDSMYIQKLSNYNKILKLKNDYLKKQTNYDENYLNTLSETLVREGKYIISKRNEFINSINNYVNDVATQISNQKENIKIEYEPSALENDFESKQKNAIRRDIFTKSSTIGPHKDNFIVKLNDKDVSLYGSQGQIRTAMIAIKLGISKYLEKYNSKQIILLDDVFSELDLERQAKLLNILNNEKQILITTTDINNISKEILEKSNLIKIVKGE